MARRVGAGIARRGLELVYGGGRVGLMGAVADAALETGGTVIGVMPEALFPKEIVHRGLSDLRSVSSMKERTELFFSLSDAFLTLPGGFGTLEEFFEAVTAFQIGAHRKPCAVLNVEGFYDFLLAQVGQMATSEFILRQHQELVLSSDDPELLLDALVAYRPPDLRIEDKWSDLNGTNTPL